MRLLARETHFLIGARALDTFGNCALPLRFPSARTDYADDAELFKRTMRPVSAPAAVHISSLVARETERELARESFAMDTIGRGSFHLFAMYTYTLGRQSTHVLAWDACTLSRGIRVSSRKVVTYRQGWPEW